MTRRCLISTIIFLMTQLAVFSPLAAKQELLNAKPLVETISVEVGPVNERNQGRVPIITWGGDMATIYALDAGLFKSEGLDVQLYLENNFPKQVEACLKGDTPFLRGTIGMINTAAEIFNRHNLDLVIICQLTWSTGGDALVTREQIKKPQQLKDRTVALQLYGPHMDYLANILKNANVPLQSVKYRWFRELSLPTYNTQGKIMDPVSAFLSDNDMDGVMCIIPDAMNLTSGGKTGTGASGSVKGAHIMLSTRTASRIIADVYAVRSDYFKQNRSKVESFVKALMKSQTKLQGLMISKSSEEYKKLLGHSADLLLGSAQASSDAEALLSDCEFVGYEGNAKFFTGQGTTRSLKNLNQEIQGSFISMGLMGKKANITQADWDFTLLAGGISSPALAKKEALKFDIRKIEEKISVEPTSWAEEGTLFQIEIEFGPNQSDFPESQYAADFNKAVEIAQTYSGSLIIIEGHSDPLGILQAKQKGRPGVEIQQMEQQAKNLSLSRSRAVRTNFLSYCSRKGLKIDESQFVAVGMGIAKPKFNPPRTKEEWNGNRRVVFRIKQIEAELNEFAPLK